MRLNIFNSLIGLCVATAVVSCSDALVNDIDNRPVGGEASDMISFVVADNNNTTRGGSFGNRPCGGAYLRSANGADSLYLNMSVADITDDPSTRATEIITLDNLSLKMTCRIRKGQADFNYYFSDTEFTNNGSVWASNPPYYWFAAGTHYNFYGYYAPDGAVGLEFKDNSDLNNTDSHYYIPTIDYTVPGDVTKHIDLVYSDAPEYENIAAADASQVPLHINHALSRISFKTGEGMAEGLIKSVSITNVLDHAVLNLSTGNWEYDNTTNTYTLTAPETATDNSWLENENNIFSLLPASTLATSEIEVKFIPENGEEGTYAASLEGIEWAKGKHYTYTITIKPEYGITIEEYPQVVDAHYVIAKAHINVPEGEEDFSWSLNVNIEGVAMNAAFEKKATVIDKLDEYQIQGFWTDRILFQANGQTKTVDQGSARGESTLLGTGSKDVYIFIPENIGEADRQIYLELEIKGVSAASQSFIQKCPEWNNEFGWEEIEEYAHWEGNADNSLNLAAGSPEGNWGYLWNRLVAYQRNVIWFNGLVYTPMVEDLVKQYNASSYTTVEPGGSTILGVPHVGGQVKITIDYSKLNALSGLDLTDANGLSNTRQLYNYSGGAVTGALEEAVKNIEGMVKVKDTSQAGINFESAALSIVAKKNKYDLKLIEKKDGDKLDISRSVYIDPQNIVWFMPAKNQLQTEPANNPLNGVYWSSTPADRNNAYTNEGDDKRGNIHKLRACRNKDK